MAVMQFGRLEISKPRRSAYWVLQDKINSGSKTMLDKPDMLNLGKQVINNLRANEQELLELLQYLTMILGIESIGKGEK